MHLKQVLEPNNAWFKNFLEENELNYEHEHPPPPHRLAPHPHPRAFMWPQAGPNSKRPGEAEKVAATSRRDRIMRSVGARQNAITQLAGVVGADL